MWTTLVLFASLGLDTLAVALTLGVAGLPRTQWAQVGLTFALFEGLMPVVGLLVGQHLSGVLGEIATYLAAVILIVVGGLEVREALAEDTAEEGQAAPAMRATGPRHPGLAPKSDGGLPGNTWRATIFRGLSVSLDELAIGFSLGVLGVPAGPALTYVAVQAFGLTFLGLWLGRRLGARIGERAELVAGVLLVLLGFALVISEATGAHWL